MEIAFADQSLVQLADQAGIDIEAAVAQLDPPQLAEFLGKIEIAERAIRAARERAKGLLEADPEALRSFLADLHAKLFLGQPHKVAETFGSRKVA